MDALRAKVLRVRELGAGLCRRTSGEKGVEDLPYVREERDKPQGREQRSFGIESGGLGWAGFAFIFSIGLHNFPHPRYAGHTPVTGQLARRGRFCDLRMSGGMKVAEAMAHTPRLRLLCLR
jgi:hypothetical protein